MIRRIYVILAILALIGQGCPSSDEEPFAIPPPSNTPTSGGSGAGDGMALNNQEDGCDGQVYPQLDDTPYVLPFAIGESYPTGLTNCSSSYHSAGKGDAYAFDFDMPEGTPFFAIRAGRVRKVVSNRSSLGRDGTSGNYLVIDHGDRTYALYYHSPRDGIEVGVGQQVGQGHYLGTVGRSGLAGYPHLHLIVVKDKYDWPYQGVPISFKNADPRHVVLKTSFRTGYTARPY